MARNDDDVTVNFGLVYDKIKKSLVRLKTWFLADHNDFSVLCCTKALGGKN